MAKQNIPLSEVISSALAPVWELPDLLFETSVDLPFELQKAILKDYILNACDFAEACKMSGITDKGKVRFLEAQIPERCKPQESVTRIAVKS